jgi:hypothetical protein
MGHPGHCQAVEYTPDNGIGSIQVLQQQGQPRMCAVYNISSLPGHMLLLPNGQIMLTYYSRQVEIFTPASLQAPKGVAPHIVSTSGTSLKTGNAYWLTGIQLNGLSQANMYGDDYQAASNYPIVQVRAVDPNCNDGQVVSLIATNGDFIPFANPPPLQNQPNSIQPDNQSGTNFTIPAGFRPCSNNTYNLSVITNGIPSDNFMQVTIKSKVPGKSE